MDETTLDLCDCRRPLPPRPRRRGDKCFKARPRGDEKKEEENEVVLDDESDKEGESSKP